MNREDLLKDVAIAIDLAKDELLKRGRVLPLLIMTFPDRPTIMSPVPDIKIIPPVLKKENPQAFTYTGEVWLKDSESGEKRDAIQVIGGTGPTRVIVILEFQKKDKIVFEKIRWLSESDLARSIVDRGLLDDAMGSILDLWSPAPPGGRVYHVARLSFEIWIPEGWRMGWEQDSKEPGGKRTTWWRVKNPHGSVRATRYYPSMGSEFMPIHAARVETQKRRESTAKDVQSEEFQNSAIISWNEEIQHPDGTKLRLHGWSRYEKAGLVFISFSYESKIQRLEVEDELASVSEIVKRVVLL